MASCFFFRKVLLSTTLQGDYAYGSICSMRVSWGMHPTIESVRTPPVPKLGPLHQTWVSSGSQTARLAKSYCAPSRLGLITNNQNHRTTNVVNLDLYVHCQPQKYYTLTSHRHLCSFASRPIIIKLMESAETQSLHKNCTQVMRLVFSVSFSYKHI